MKTVFVPCNLCGRDEWNVLYPATLNASAAIDLSAFRCTSDSYGHHAQIVRCRFCGHVYANPRWVGGELLKAYQTVEDEEYLREREGRVLTFSRHLAALEEITGVADSRALLDVGAYIGVFVEVACEVGWNAYGVEPSEWAVSVAHRRGIPLIQGTLAAKALQGRRFDVITMWDVIEHVDDPLVELERSFMLLRPGGIIAVHTMDIESRVARLMGERWPWLMDMHIHYFSQRTLCQFLQKCGFDVVWAGKQGRYLRLGYLASRIGGLSEPLGRWFGRAVRRLDLAGAAIPVNSGDLFTVYARRPQSRSAEKDGSTEK